MKKHNQKAAPFEWHVRLHFVIAASIFLFITVGFSMFAMISQLANGNDYGGSVFNILSVLLAPVFSVVASFLLAPKSANKLERAFWTILLSFIAMLIFVTVQQLTIILPIYTGQYNQDSWIMQEALRLTLSYVPVLVYFGYLYWLRKKLVKN